MISGGARFRAIVAALSVLTLAGATSWVCAQQASAPATVPAPATTAPNAAPAAGTIAAPVTPVPTTPAAGAPAAVTPAATVAAPAPHPAVPAVKATSGKVAAKPVDKPLWTQLTKTQQEVLQPLAADWEKMEGVKKQKWVEIANRFGTMKPDEQQRVHEKMRNWAVELTPEQRRVVRENFANTKKIDPGQKSAQWEQYQALPEAEKKRLAAEAALKKKQVANLPSSAQANMPKVAPIKSGPPPAPAAKPAAAPAGTQPAATVPNGAPAAAGSAPAAAVPATTAPAGTLPAAPPPAPNGK